MNCMSTETFDTEGMKGLFYDHITKIPKTKRMQTALKSTVTEKGWGGTLENKGDGT